MRKPYVILIGSASGIGKSTIASKLAKELNIKHLIESDFIRAVVRGIIGKEYAPALHSSSYDAYKNLRNRANYNSYEDLVSAGFDEHASYVIPGLEKIIQRAITDFDDIIIEGQFKDYAEIYFFVLSSDEESHKERFVKRAIQIHRGGKQLDFFTENRIIHNHLLHEAEKYNVSIIKTETIDKSIEQILTIINKSCANIKLTNTVDELKEVVDTIINQNNGSIEKIIYSLKGFKDPLVREVNVSDYDSAKRFIDNIDKNEKVKEDLINLYNISKYREMLICASNNETLEKIKKELTDKGFVYNE